MKTILTVIVVAVTVSVLFLLYQFMRNTHTVFDANRYDALAVETEGNNSFIYLTAKSWLEKGGAKTIQHAVAVFEEKHPCLRVVSWFFTDDKKSDDSYAYVVWFHHEPRGTVACSK